MEALLILAALPFVVAFVLWRSRSRTPKFDSSPIDGLPDDLRDKNTGQMSLPNHGRPGGGPGWGP